MSDFYFEKFPTIVYNNLRIKDLSRRVRLSEQLRLRGSLFMPATVPPQLRPDQLSEAFYKDSSLDWLIFLTNEIVDPYYQWPLDDSEFLALITDKYGDIETAKQRVKFFRLNWPSDDKQVLKVYFDRLPDQLKKYYDPVFNARGAIYAYTRKQDDYVQSTNKIVQMTFDVTTDTFANGEFVDIKHSGTVIGSAEVLTSNTTQITINHVQGAHAANSTYTVNLVGELGTSNVICNDSSVLYQNIPDDEAAFWSPVSYYDIENEKNERNKYIILLDPSIVQNILEEIRTKLK
jgi:hypothetical protein